jgi:hypothetical protein
MSARATISIDPIKLARASAVCIVTDRAHFAEARSICEELAGGWLDAYRVWQRLPEMRYLVLLADNATRIVQRAPLAMLGRDDDGLRLGLQEACTRLSDVTCLWVRLLEPKALEILGEIVLADSVSEGNA